MNRARASISLLALALLVPGAALAVNTGSADFSNYVSAGDSLTAGYQSAGLVDTSQLHDYVILIAHQAGVADFEQPLISPPGIPSLLKLFGLFPALIAPGPGQGHPENLNLPRLYNNLGIPGETLNSMLTVKSDVPFLGHAGFHDIILRGFGTQLEEVIGAKPTFVTLWIGNNDALGAVTSGNLALLTPVPTFQAEYTTIVGAIATMTHAKMAIANIPDVTSLPFVTTLPTILVDPTTNLPVTVGGHTIPLIGPKGLLGPGDHVLLSAGPDLAKGLGIPRPIGTGLPLPAADVLLAADAATVNDHIQQFNAIIQATAQQVGAALVDIHAQFNNLAQNGVEVGGIPFTASFLTGGVFSYDGIHPTAFGYAYTANLFIDAINQKFGAQIPEADLSPAIFGSSAGGSASAEAQELDSAGSAGQQKVWVKYLLSAEAVSSLRSMLEGMAAAAAGTGGHHHHHH
jgi:lysophospholipase L1-like esterase